MADLVGFAATALIVVSLMMSSLLWLRIVGMAGSAMFTIYGLAIGAWPVVATNAVITSIHVIHLVRLYLVARADRLAHDDDRPVPDSLDHLVGPFPDG